MVPTINDSVVYKKKISEDKLFRDIFTQKTRCKQCSEHGLCWNRHREGHWASYPQDMELISLVPLGSVRDWHWTCRGHVQLVSNKLTVRRLLLRGRVWNKTQIQVPLLTSGDFEYVSPFSHRNIMTDSTLLNRLMYIKCIRGSGL